MKKGLQIKVMVAGKWQRAELVKCNVKTCLVKLENYDIVKVRKFKLAGG